MTTCKDVFNQAMGLMDEVDRDQNDWTNHMYTMEYRGRTPYIIETLLRELYFASDTFNDPKHKTGKRPIPPMIVPTGAVINENNLESYMNRPIDLDDFVARTILPYGLAAHLLLQEDVQAASFFQQRYEELLRWWKSSIPNEFEAIWDVYGISNEHGQYSRW